MARPTTARPVTVGVLALQGAFSEHILLLHQAAAALKAEPPWHSPTQWQFFEVRTSAALDECDALIIPGGESTTMSLVAQRSGLLDALRDFVKVKRKPTWGTCAGLILLAESANRTKKGGQELIGGLDVRVNRNHFGRQVESFEADLDLPFLKALSQEDGGRPFHTVFIRAPVVQRILPHNPGVQVEEARKDDTVVAPARAPENPQAAKAMRHEVEVLARLAPSSGRLDTTGNIETDVGREGDIVAVRQGNVFGTAFHPELTGDPRIHQWWLGEVLRATEQ